MANYLDKTGVTKIFELIHGNYALSDHNHDAGDITSGTFGSARIPGLASSKITALTGYAIATASANIAATDSLNTALGKLQYKLNNHTHDYLSSSTKYAGSSSVGGAATSANKVNTNLTIKLNSGTTEGTNLFTFNGSTAKTINITPAAIGAATSGHTHDYLTGITNSSSNTTTAEALVASVTASGSTVTVKDFTGTVGSTTTPIYFNAGVPTALSYTIAKSVPSNAVFTDTTYSAGVGLALSSNAFKCKLKSETNATYDSAAVTNTTNRQYAVVVDKSGYLSVNVPWVDNTWRTVQVNGTSIANNTLNLKAGTNISLTNSNGTVTIASSMPSHTHETITGSYTGNGGKQAPNYFGTGKIGGLMMNTTVNDNNTYKNWLIMDCYTGSDAGGATAIGVSRTALGAFIMQSDANRNKWNNSAELLGTHNYENYCAKKDHTHNYAGSSSAGGAATSANKLKYNSFTKASDITWDYNIWAANGVVSDVETMGYAAVMNVGYGLSRGWQIWNRRSDENLYWRKVNDGGTAWDEYNTILDSNNWSNHITLSSIGAASTSAMTGATSSAAGKAGLVPAPAAGKQTSFLRGDGTWVVPTNTTYSVMTGATSSAAGTSGLVPAPAANKHTSFLRGDGTWVVPTNTTYSVMTGATSSAAGTSGLVPTPAAGKHTSFLRGDGTWVVPTNTTYNVVSSSANGLAPKVVTGGGTIDNASNDYVLTSDNGTIGWRLLPANAFNNTTYSVMTGATSSKAGTSGLVPAPAAGKQTSFLRGDGTWVVPTDTKVTQTVTTTNAAYPLLLAPKDQTATTTTTAYFDSDVTLNPSTNILNNAKVYEAYLQWGGTSLSGSISPIDVALDSQFSANRLSFMPAEDISVEYSTDSGSTWIDYGLTNLQKQSLVTTGLSQALYMGKKTTGQKPTDKLRVTITATNGKTYFSLKKILIYLSTQGATGTKVLIERSAIGSDTTYTQVGEYSVSGWSGWNSIPYTTNFGGSTSQTSQTRRIRMTFSFVDCSASYIDKTAFQVSKISMHGETSWSNSGGSLASTGHLYSYDINKTATFPAALKATTLYENGKALSAKYITTDTYHDKFTVSEKATLDTSIHPLIFTTSACEEDSMDDTLSYNSSYYLSSTGLHATTIYEGTSKLSDKYQAKGSYAASSHTHSYAGSSSVGGAATSANKVNTNLTIKLNSGTTEGTNLFTFNGSTAKTINITPSAIGAAPTSHASSATTYGVATTSNYGHVKISNGDCNTVSSANGLAAGMDHTHGNYVAWDKDQQLVMSDIGFGGASMQIWSDVVGRDSSSNTGDHNAGIQGVTTNENVATWSISSVGVAWFANEVSTKTIKYYQSNNLSDINEKNIIINDIPLTIKQIAEAPTVEFKWKYSPGTPSQVGTIAQYWQDIVPQAITSYKKKDPISEQDKEVLALDYNAIGVVSSIKVARHSLELEEKVKSLQEENDELKSKLVSLESRLAEIEEIIESIL